MYKVKMCRQLFRAPLHSLTAAADNAMKKALAEHKATFGMCLLENVSVGPCSAVASVDDGHNHNDAAILRFPFIVAPPVSNSLGQLHGGAYAALADVFTTVHLWGLVPDSKHVSVDFNIRYIAGAPLGACVLCDTEVTKLGRRLAFTRFSFRSSTTDSVYAEGSHTKAMM